MFLHNCANAIWSLKGPECPCLSNLVTSRCQKVSITLHKMQAFSILSQAIAMDLATSQLPPLQNTPPITTTNLLQGVDFWHINMVNLLQVVGYGHGKLFIASLSKLDVMSLLLFLNFTPLYMALGEMLSTHPNQALFHTCLACLLAHIFRPCMVQHFYLFCHTT